MHPQFKGVFFFGCQLGGLQFNGCVAALLLCLEDVGSELLRLQTELRGTRLERAERLESFELEASLVRLDSLFEDLVSVFFAPEDRHLVVRGHVGNRLEDAHLLVAFELVELGQLEKSVGLRDDAGSGEEWQ